MMIIVDTGSLQDVRSESDAISREITHSDVDYTIHTSNPYSAKSIGSEDIFELRNTGIDLAIIHINQGSSLHNSSLHHF